MRKRPLLPLFGLLLTGVLCYGVLVRFLRQPAFKAHTAFTFHQILDIHQNTPLIEAASDAWEPLSDEEIKSLLTRLEGHVVDWNSTAETEVYLLDSWGRPCLVERRRSNENTHLKLTSSGPDRRFDTDDDVIASSKAQ